MAFTAADLARWFATPLLAVLAIVATTALFCLALAAVAVTLAVTAGAGWATGMLIGVYLWAALSCFGVFEAVPLLDASRVTNLPWALHTGSAWALPVVALLAGAGCVVALRTADAPRHARLRDLLGGRGLLIAIPLLAAGFAALAAIDADDSTTDVLAGFFAGSFGSLPDYLAVMILLLMAGAGTAARLETRATGRYRYEAIRLGSPTRWTVRFLAAELGRALWFAATIPSAVILISLARRPALLETLADTLPVVLLIAGVMAVQLAMYVTVITAIRWITASSGAWPGFAGVALVLGYPLFVALGPVNAFAAFSLDGSAAGGVSIAALLSAAVVAAGAVAVAFVTGALRRAPAIA